MRYNCDLPVYITLKHATARKARVETRALQVSVVTLYLLSDVYLPYGTHVVVNFRLPALKQDTVCDGVVRWCKSGGFGVQLGSLRAIDVWGVHQMLKTLDQVGSVE